MCNKINGPSDCLTTIQVAAGSFDHLHRFNRCHVHLHQSVVIEYAAGTYRYAIFQIHKHGSRTHWLSDSHTVLFVTQVYHIHTTYFVYELINGGCLCFKYRFRADSCYCNRRLISFNKITVGADYHFFQTGCGFLHWDGIGQLIY